MTPPPGSQGRDRPADADPSADAGAGEAAEGWEGLAEEEPSGGSLAPSAELEAALREASEAVEGRHGGSPAEPGRAGRGARAVDEATIQALSAELQGLKTEYESAREELATTRDRLLRLTADFDNFRKRTLKERQESQLYGHQNLVKELLATVDNLERAAEHAGAGGGAGDLQGLREGVELVLRELSAILQRYGVKEIQAVGQPFDPELHEALAQLPDASVAPNTIVQVLQKGYVLRDRMLRPARVIVSRAPDAGASGSETG